MPTRILDKPNDESVFVINAKFYDEDDALVLPDTLVWSLRNENGTIINDRSLVPVTPAASVDILLYGDDLKYSEGTMRVLTFYATYDSDLGSDLPLNDEVSFYIQDLMGV